MPRHGVIAAQQRSGCSRHGVPPKKKTPASRVQVAGAWRRPTDSHSFPNARSSALPSTSRVAFRSLTASDVQLCRASAFAQAAANRRAGPTQKTRRDEPGGFFVLATSYSRTAYRRTTIGAAAFHCRVRNGNGWDRCATVTRVRNRTGVSLLS
jgi:hypothetical protein